MWKPFRLLFLLRRNWRLCIKNVQAPAPHSSLQSVFNFIYIYEYTWINGACACLKEACTVVLHSGLCPSHTQPPPTHTHHHCCHVPLRTKPSATWDLPTLPYLLLRPPASAQKEAVLPGSLVKSSRDSSRPYSLRQKTFTTAASGNVDLQAQKSNTHTFHFRTWLCVTLFYFNGVTL